MSRVSPSSREASLRMARVRQKGTDAELSLRKELHARGLRYRLQVPLLTKPRRVADIVFPRAKVAVCGEGVQSHLGPPECCGIPITLIDAESAFDALTTLATTPPGWVCVPVEPTEAMLDAALWTGVFDTNQNGCDADAVTKAYRAMIAAPGAKE